MCPLHPTFHLISNLFLLPPMSNKPTHLVVIGPTVMMIVVVVPPHGVAEQATKRRNLYPITITSTVKGIQASQQEFKNNMHWYRGWGWFLKTQRSETPSSANWNTKKQLEPLMTCILPPLTPLCEYLCTPPPSPRRFHIQWVLIWSSRCST